MGFDPQDEATQRGNALLLRALLILWTVYKHGRHGSLEHPAGAYTWFAQTVRALFGKQGCGYLDFAARSFGAPFQKPTRLGLVRGGFLQPLARPCVHGRAAHRHPLVGTAGLHRPPPTRPACAPLWRS